MSYLHHIRHCNNFQATHFHPFIIEGRCYGKIQPDFAQYLLQYTEVFQPVAERGISFVSHLNDYASRSAAIAPIIRELYQQGVIDTWVGEAYPVTLDFEQPAALEVERAATLYLGVKTFGIHVNGLVRKAEGIYVWVGTRTSSKPFWPGKLDQMVAGGQPVGLGLLENVIKEAKEEAGIPAELAAQAQYVGALNYRQMNPRGLENSTIFVYDLWLAESFVPHNTDGEVARFDLLPLAEVARLTETTADFKDNCNLVNIDLLLRTGFIGKEHPAYADLQQGLYHSLKPI